ncbi:hypothetical protein ACFWOJ_38095 [Streptomyces sp. NPDC058439]
MDALGAISSAVSRALPVLVEEVRLLIDLGLLEYALARAERAEDGGAG